jgi:hypothetical protein
LRLSLFDFLAPSELGTAAPLWSKPELPDGTAFSLVWRNGNALSAIFTRVTSATCGSRIIASIRSSVDRFSFATRAAIAAWVKAVFLFGVPF